MVLITIYWEYIFAPIQILGKVIVLLLCFGEEGQTGKILSETVVARNYKRLGITVTLLTLLRSKRAFMPIHII